MFKGFQNTSRTNGFNGFPALNFQMNNEAYGFSGCTFWLDAAYGLNTQTDLAAVSSWQTRIGGFSFNQPTAGNQPAYLASVTSYNNLPVVNFIDTARHMNATNNGGVLLSSDWTFCFVANLTTGNTNCNTVIGNTINNQHKIVINASPITSFGIAYMNVNTVLLGDANAPGTTVKIVVMTRKRIVVNGTEVATGSIVGPITLLNQLGGAQSGTASLSFRSRMAELLSFNKEFSLIDCQTLSDRLNSKYAIY